MRADVSRLSAWLDDDRHPQSGWLRERAALWNAALKPFAAPPAFFLDDPRDAFALLLACWSRGFAPLLLPDRQPATVGRFPSDRLLLELPEGLEPLPCLSRKAGRDELALRLLTSGSTGERKEVVKTFGQLEDECEMQERTNGSLFAGRELLTTVSHQHIYGLLFLVVRPALEGIPLPARRFLLWDEMASRLRTGPCVLVASPAHFSHLAAGMETDPPSDLLVISSGGAVPPSLGRAVARHARLLEVYGSTETGGIAQRTWNPEDVGDWEPFDGLDWEILADRRLQVRASWVDGGSVVLGDLAEACGSGFRITGRADRIVKVAEKRASLDEMEARLREHLLVDDACFCLPPSGNGRQELSALVEPSRAGWKLLSKGRAGFVAALREVLSERFEPVLLPRRFRFGGLPRDSRGKIELSRALSRALAPELSLDGIEAAILSTEGGLRAEATLPQSYPRLEGHFPGFPVVPGVAQLCWAVDAVGSLVPGFSPRRLRAVKFHSLLRPGSDFVLDVAPAGDGWEFCISSPEGKRYSSGRLSP